MSNFIISKYPFKESDRYDITRISSEKEFDVWKLCIESGGLYSFSSKTDPVDSSTLVNKTQF